MLWGSLNFIADLEPDNGGMKETAGRQQKRDFGWIFFACGVKENRRMVVAAKKGLWVSQLESVSLSECTGGSRFIRTNRTE